MSNIENGAIVQANATTEAQATKSEVEAIEAGTIRETQTPAGRQTAANTNYFIDAGKISVKYRQEEGNSRTILNDVSLHVRRGELITVVGPSGCGKSTLLRLVLGAQSPTSGKVLVDGSPVTRVSRDCGIVYQSYSLFPHLSVLDNICFGLVLEQTNLFDAISAAPFYAAERIIEAIITGAKRGRKNRNVETDETVSTDSGLDAGVDSDSDAGTDSANAAAAQLQKSAQSPFVKALEIFPFIKVRRQAREIAYEFLAGIGLDRADAEKFPHELSGGMRQRVAIAQAVIMKPKILLMDEPFGALDKARREEMQDFIHEQWAKHQLTVFFVTHDLDEAIRLGTRLICLSQYWSDANKHHGKGARIVVDRKVLGGHVKPSTFGDSDEFKQLIRDIGKAGLSPHHVHAESEFDLSHPDAVRSSGEGMAP